MERDAVFKYKRAIIKIAREECIRYGMKNMIEDAIQEGYLAVLETQGDQGQKINAIRSRVRSMLRKERREKYIKDQLKSLGCPTSTLKADVLSEAEYMLHECGIVIVSELIKRLQEVGISPPSKPTLYRWLKEWSAERGLRHVSGYIPS